MSEGDQQSIVECVSHCQLFAFLDDQQRAELAARCSLQSFESGSLLASEGESGDCLYVIADGVMEVFTTVSGSEVVLARLDRRGDHAGEQALRERGDGQRNASLRANGGLRVVVMDKATYWHALSMNPAIGEHVRRVGERQLATLSLVERSLMYRALAAFDTGEGWSRDLSFKTGETVFKQGEPGDAVYVIRSGRARVSQTEDGQEQVLAVLHDGQTFGELAVLGADTRQATVTAISDLEVVAFDGQGFLQVTGQVPELHDYLGALKRIYALADGTATQFDGEFRGQPALVTLIRMDEGREAVIHHAKDLYSATIDCAEKPEFEEIEYHDSNRRILRTLGHRSGRLLHVHAEGPWPELDRIHAALLAEDTLDALALERFQQTGDLFDQRPAVDLSLPEAVFCNCLKVTRREVEDSIAHGASTLDAVTQDTGATSICGGCTGRIAGLIGSDGQSVRIIEAIDVGRDVKSFRFEPAVEAQAECEPLRAALPGQHVVVSAEIGGHWVHRPYTITSPADCVAWREITVKRESHGHFSNWLFQNPTEPQLRLTHPQGSFWADLERPEPLVCLVAGIGVTPALALARTRATANGDAAVSPALHIDYSARTQPDLVFRDELEQLAAEHPDISVQYRLTGAGERLDASGLQRINEQFPNARYMICGPAAFQAFAHGGLLKIGVPEERVQVEVFTPVGHAPEDSGNTRTRGDALRMWVVLGLTVLYVLQDLLDMDWGLLTRVQQQAVTWQTVTGLMLLGYIGFQWYLPYLRLAGDRARSIRHYRWHRYLGVAAPVLLFAHAASLEFGYAFWFGVLFLANTVIGALDRTLIAEESQRQRYERIWLPIHVAVSCGLVVLLCFHIYIAYAYK